MNDPYQVLGISRNASEDEVKTAYRELAKKYHPDNYANNPLADLAAEKMKEINEAYDQIIKSKRTGNEASYTGNYSNTGSGGYSGSGRYANVRNLINTGRVGEAQSILDAVTLRDRDAEWHFLMGSVMYRKGWINEAYVNFQNAYRSDPGNPEYREAVERISRQMNGGFYGGGDFRGYNSGAPGGCNGCDLCSALLCADCLCNGGGC